jgi:hypothetical protein
MFRIEETLFYLKAGASKIFQNVGAVLRDYTAAYLRRH